MVSKMPNNPECFWMLIFPLIWWIRYTFAISVLKEKYLSCFRMFFFLPVLKRNSVDRIKFLSFYLQVNRSHLRSIWQTNNAHGNTINIEKCLFFAVAFKCQWKQRSSVGRMKGFLGFKIVSIWRGNYSIHHA